MKFFKVAGISAILLPIFLPLSNYLNNLLIILAIIPSLISIVLLTFILLGFMKLGKIFDSKFLSVSSVLLILFMIIKNLIATITLFIYVKYGLIEQFISETYIQYISSATFIGIGLFSILSGIALLRLSKKEITLSKTISILSIVYGIFLAIFSFFLISEKINTLMFLIGTISMLIVLSISILISIMFLKMSKKYEIN